VREGEGEVVGEVVRVVGVKAAPEAEHEVGGAVDVADAAVCAAAKADATAASCGEGEIGGGVGLGTSELEGECVDWRGADRKLKII